MTERKKAYIYTRVSTSMQVDGYSLDAQYDEIKRYADYLNYDVVYHYTDKGVSGKSDERPQFQMMMNDIISQKDKVEYVLVFKLSRFGRNCADTMKNLQTMQDYGVNLICVKDGIDTSVGAGKLMVSIISAVAEMELENIHEQTIAGRQKKAREGKWNGGFAPYGYTINKEKQILEIVEEEAKTVRYIFKLYTEEELGFVAITKRLNAEGYEKIVRQNGTTNVFTANFVKKIVDNPVYMGKIAYGRRKTEKVIGSHGKTHIVKESNPDNIILVDGCHEPIVSEDVWNTARDRRTVTAHKREKVNPDHYFLLSGIVKCPACGKSMYGVANRKKKPSGGYYSTSYSYKCRKNKSDVGSVCSFAKQYNCAEIDEEFYDIISFCFSSPLMIKEKLEKLSKNFDESEIKERIAKLNSRLKHWQTLIENIESEMLTLDVSSEFYEREYGSLKKRLHESFTNLDEVEKLLKIEKDKLADMEKTKATEREVFVQLFYYGLNFASLSMEEQKNIVSRLVTSVEIFPEKRDSGYIKSVHFSIPIYMNRNGEYTDISTVSEQSMGMYNDDGYIRLLTEEESAELKKRYEENQRRYKNKGNIDKDGNTTVEMDKADFYETYYPEYITFCNENGRTAKDEEFWLYAEYKALCKDGKSFDDYLKNCRPKKTTDETVCLLSKLSDAKHHKEKELQHDDR